MRLAQVRTDHPIQRGSNLFADQKAAGNIVDYIEIDYNTYSLLVITGETDTVFIDLEEKFNLEFQPFKITEV